MNDELDVMRRIGDYHDHITVPQVLLADDLHRGRQRVRRNRGLLAGGLALGIASVVAAMSLATGGDRAEQPQPIGPPTDTFTFHLDPDNPGLREPLIAPESLLGVRELGFHVEGLASGGAWLLPDRHGLEVVVANGTFAAEVYYRGVTPGRTGGEEVSINGVPGAYAEGFDGNTYWTSIAWEYAPDSWATVSRGDDRVVPERRAQLLTIAKAIRPGGMAALVPFRIGTASAPILRSETVARVELPRSRDSWWVSFESGLSITGSPARARSSCDRQSSPLRSVEAFTYRGHTGCLLRFDDVQPQVGTVVLEVDGTELEVHTQGASLLGYELEDLKQLLADITVAPSDDRSTWSDLTTALGRG